MAANWRKVGTDQLVLSVGPRHFHARYVVTFAISEGHQGVHYADWINEHHERHIGVFASEHEAQAACIADAVSEGNERWIETKPQFAEPPSHEQPTSHGAGVSE